MSYPIIIENIGTFAQENVNFVSSLPSEWSGAFYYLDSPVDSMIVEDSVELTFTTWERFSINIWG